MNQMIVFLMTVPLKCNNAPDYETTFHLHFLKNDEQTRFEVDQSQDDRPQKAYYWPLISDSHQSEVAQFLKSAEEYLRLCEESVRPIRTCNKRGRSNCMIFFKGIFGRPSQMGHILAKTFDGEHRWIQSGEIEIDSMFFTATGEPIQDDNPNAAYKERDTFILCNPNAMFYQHMINFPHAFYLRWFLQKGVNVLVWNYRGYGLTKARRCIHKFKNTPSPDAIK